MLSTNFFDIIAQRSHHLKDYFFNEKLGYLLKKGKQPRLYIIPNRWSVDYRYTYLRMPFSTCDKSVT